MPAFSLTRNQSLIGWLIAAAGALQILAVLISITGSGDSSAVYFLSNVGIGAAFILIMLWAGKSRTASIVYDVAAAGWLLLALGSILNLGFLFTLALVVALAGGVIASCFVFLGHVFGARANISFVIAMALGAVNLLLVLLGGAPGWVSVPIVILFGAALIVAGASVAGRR
jgi:hypothetical protein